MDDLFRSYWWLLFPLGFFVFGAWDRWLAYRRSRDHLDLLRTYTSQGKDPPPELLKSAREEIEVEAPYDPYYGGRYARRYHRRYWRYRYGYYGPWRGFFVTGSVALGFWLAAQYADFPGTEGPFRIVAIIMTCVAAGNLIAAIFSTTFRDK
jgi:hypothetical protein